MRKRARVYVRWAVSDADLVTAAARRVDLSVSELVRRATLSAALEAIRTGAVPPPVATTGRADGRSR